jgi:murein DD-endopeptidase MepM/ murein hydrolase activator NlpD
MRMFLIPLAVVTILALGAPGASAQGQCDEMLMPAVQLKQVSRGLSRGHSGLDLTAPYGSPVRAAMAGTVIFAGRYFGYGNMVDIRHADGLITRYGHLSAFAPALRVGRNLATGELLGRVGTSGLAHGPHLHFEVRDEGRPIDPKPFLALAACPGTIRVAVEEARAPDRPAVDARPGGLLQ